MARLYFRGTDAAKLGATFQREGQLVGKRCLRHMRQVAKLVMDYSVRGAPVDYKGPKGQGPLHELERSHRIEEQYYNGRIVASVLVGGMVGAVNVDKYVTYIHDSFGYNLGKASIAKQNADPKIRVGPRFLERALEEFEHEFDDWAEDVYDELVGALMG